MQLSCARLILLPEATGVGPPRTVGDHLKDFSRGSDPINSRPPGSDPRVPSTTTFRISQGGLTPLTHAYSTFWMKLIVRGSFGCTITSCGVPSSTI